MVQDKSPECMQTAPLLTAHYSMQDKSIVFMQKALHGNKNYFMQAMSSVFTTRLPLVFGVSLVFCVSANGTSCHICTCNGTVQQGSIFDASQVPCVHANINAQEVWIFDAKKHPWCSGKRQCTLILLCSCHMAPHSKVQVFVFIQTELHGKVHVETTKRM